MTAIPVIAAVCLYYLAKLKTMNFISGLWLPWGLPLVNAKFGACPAQDSKDIDNVSHLGRHS